MQTSVTGPSSRPATGIGRMNYRQCQQQRQGSVLLRISVILTSVVSAIPTAVSAGPAGAPTDPYLVLAPGGPGAAVAGRRCTCDTPRRCHPRLQPGACESLAAGLAALRCVDVGQAHFNLPLGRGQDLDGVAVGNSDHLARMGGGMSAKLCVAKGQLPPC